MRPRQSGGGGGGGDCHRREGARCRRYAPSASSSSSASSLRAARLLVVLAPPVSTLSSPPQAVPRPHQVSRRGGRRAERGLPAGRTEGRAGSAGGGAGSVGRGMPSAVDSPKLPNEDLGFPNGIATGRRKRICWNDGFAWFSSLLPIPELFHKLLESLLITNLNNAGQQPPLRLIDTPPSPSFPHTAPLPYSFIHVSW